MQKCQTSGTNARRLLPMLFAAIHGFRMPLFFLLSGFFTMLVFRRRGRGPLLRQRVSRIFLPLVVSIITLVPLCHVLVERGVTTATREPLVEAIVAGNVAGVQEGLAAGAPADDRDRTFHRPRLVWAAMASQPHVAAAIVQPAHAWTMSLGLIGLFHCFCSRPSPVVPWLSNASC